MPRRRGRVSTTLAVVLTLASTACGSSGKTTTTAAGGPSTAAAAPTTTTAPVKRSAPRWETVTTFSGTGATRTDPFTILPDAIQWRTRWSCDSGDLKIESIPPPRRGEPVTPTSACKGKTDKATQETDAGYSIVTGKVQLSVTATGPWSITVDQQIDTPLEEPPLPAMAAAKVLGQGDFYNVEMKGSGTARVYQLADGSRALRLENFEVSSNTDLYVWVSTLATPKSSADAVGAPYVDLGRLKSTLGSENYILPAQLTPDKMKSIVIWCVPVRVAYTAATLAPPA